jgi:hypothetical protein
LGWWCGPNYSWPHAFVAFWWTVLVADYLLTSRYPSHARIQAFPARSIWRPVNASFFQRIMPFFDSFPPLA